MATYDPPQPMWKRNLAGILDFFLAFFVCVYGVSEISGNRSDTTHVVGKPLVTYGSGAGFDPPETCWGKAAVLTMSAKRRD